MLIEVLQAQKKENIDDDKAVDILAMLIGAGVDTTSSNPQSFFKIMALHPEVCRKLIKVCETPIYTPIMQRFPRNHVGNKWHQGKTSNRLADQIHALAK